MSNDISTLVEKDRRKYEILEKLRRLLNMSYECDYGISDTFKAVQKIMKDAEGL